MDYPQHLALAALLRRYFESGSPEQQVLQYAPLSYNGTFHLLTALLSYIFRPETAGRIVLSLIAPLTGSAALVTLQTARRPRWLAFLLLPLCYSHALGWGFVNFSLGAPLCLLLFALWLRWLRGQRKLVWVLVPGCLLLAYTHVLAMLCLCVCVAVGFFAEMLPRREEAGVLIRSLLRAPLPVLPAVLYSLLVWRSHRSAPHIYWENHDGQDIPAWEKVWYFGRWATGNLTDSSDQRVLLFGLGALLLLLLAAFVRREDFDDTQPVFRVQAWLWLLLFLVVPRVVMSSWFIFERLPIFFLFFFLAGIPLNGWLRAEGGQLNRWLAGAVAALALVGGVATMRSFAGVADQDDASAIIDAIPEDRKVVGVMYATDGAPSIGRNMWVHLPAYYLVRKRGELAYTFLHYAALPVRYRDQGAAPPRVPPGVEWSPQRYSPNTDYGRYFDTVLVRSPYPNEDPKLRVFGSQASQVRLLEQRGRFYLYDASALALRNAR